MGEPAGDGMRPAEITRQLYAAWSGGQIAELEALTSDDVVVSGYLADGVPLRGREAVFGMVRDFYASGLHVDMSDIEELSDSAALSRVDIHGEGADADGASSVVSYWVWTFEHGKLKNSHVFTSRDLAIAWFAALDVAT
jgi:ketosteroid isomerase-like protein